MAKTGKFGDLRRRLVFLLLALVVYRIGAHIPVPGIDPAQLQQFFKGQEGGILGMANLMSGGALSRFTVFALGIMPYISASIIMQLLTYVLPAFEQIKKEGEAGRRKITQYTRYGTLGLALFQSLGIAIALESSAEDPRWKFATGRLTRLQIDVQFDGKMLSEFPQMTGAGQLADPYLIPDAGPLHPVDKPQSKPGGKP